MAVFAKVLFDYTAEKEDELSLKVGELIENVAKHDGGWWEGSLRGKRGWFPDNFVEETAAPAPAPAKTAPPAKPPAPTAAKKKKLAKCTFDYDAENGDELTIRVGEIITVLNEEEEGWWKGELNGKVGMFPNNFVEEIVDAAPPAQPAAPKVPEKKEDPAPPKEEEHESEGSKKKIAGVGFGNIFAGGAPMLRPTGSFSAVRAAKPTPEEKEKAPPALNVALKPPAAVPPKAVAPIPEVKKDTRKLVKAIYEYQAQNEDELTLAVGDLFRINKQVSEGWAEGEFHDGRKGLFPDNFVEDPSDAEIKAYELEHAPKVEEPPKPLKPVPKPEPASPKVEPKVELRHVEKAEPPKPEPPKPSAALKPPTAKPEPPKPEPPKVEAKPEPPAPTPADAPVVAKKPPPPAGKPKPPVPVKSDPQLDKPAPPASKPEPLAVKHDAPPPPAKHDAPATPHVKHDAPPPPAKHDAPAAPPKAEPSPPAVTKEQFEALEQQNKALQEDLNKLKKIVQTLVEDLDSERAARIKMQVDVDRLKKNASL